MALLILVDLALFCSPTFAAPLRVLGKHIPAAAAHLQPTEALPETNDLKLAIGLPLRNRDALTNLLAELYNPAHPNYRHYLTPEEFTARFGPTKAQYETAERFARANGLSVIGTHVNRLILDVHGKVGDIQRAFHTTLRSYPHPTEGRSFYAPDIEPSVESDIPILDVSGLNNYSRPHPKSLGKVPDPNGGGHTPKSGSGPNGNYLGADFRNAYAPGVTLTGTGQVVGLLEFDGYYPNDITSYESLAGLPNVPLTNVLLDGYDGTPTTGYYSANDEVALDIEVTIAMAPGLSKVLVYEAGPYGYANDIISRMACDNEAAQLSCSWDFGSDANATTDQIFLQMAAQGQSFFNASGDSGAYTGSVPSPDDNPYITLVGGTTLITTSGHAWVSETTWNAGGGLSSSGGFSSIYPLPDWQTGISMTSNQGSTTKRNIPDVSMVADDISVVADNGQQYPIYGTSAGSPLWAAFTALINQQAAANGYPAVGFLNPAVYSLAKGTNFPVYFHDITTGNNTNRTSSRRFLAAAGYDLCTGWGTPTGAALLKALALPDTLGVLPITGFSASGPPGGPFSIDSLPVSLTNSSEAALSWAVENSSSWLEVSPTSGTLAPGQNATLWAKLNSAATNLASGQYTATLQVSNLTSQVSQARQFTLSVGSSLVRNGGFETGDFSYWTLKGDVDFNSIDDGSDVSPHSGNYAAILGQTDDLATLSQVIPTRPDQAYSLSFWYTSLPDSENETGPNELVARFDGKTLLDAVNLGQQPWTQALFTVSATSTNALLEFRFRDEPYFLGLDDISLVPIPAMPLVLRSVSQTNGAIQLSWSSTPGLSYQVQYRADFTTANWSNLGPPIVATETTTGASDPITSNSSRFYRVLQLP